MARRSGVNIRTTIYQRFKGADFSTDPSLVDKARSPLCTNMISDGGGMPEKRCGWRTLHQITDDQERPQRINGIFSGVSDGVKRFYIHAGSGFYLWDGDSAPVKVLDGVNDGKSRAVSLNGKLWVVTGGEFLCCDGETVRRVREMDCYEPTTTITREPDGGGVSLEDVNMLSPRRKNGFQTDGEARAFRVDAAALDLSFTVNAPVAAGTALKFDDDSAHGGAWWSFTSAGALQPGARLRLDMGEKKAYIGAVGVELQKSNSGTDITTVAAMDAVCAVRAWVWDEEAEAFTVCRETGVVTFQTAPAAPDAGQADGLVISFPKTVPGYTDQIDRCSIITTYGAGTSDRIVLSGNPEHPNRDWTSGLNDPTYFPDLLYSNVGIDGVAIRGYCRIGSSLAIVKEDNGQDSTVFFRSASVSDSGEANFTLQQAIAGVGAVCCGAFATLLDEALFLSGTGIYAVTSNYLTGERVGQNRSFYLNAKLTAEDLRDCEAVSWNGMYLLSIGNGHVYVLDGRQNKTYRSESLGDFVYEGYYWENVPARCWMCFEEDGKESLFFGTADGRVCRFNTDEKKLKRFSDDGAAIDAVWATKMDDDGNATILKTMLKRGCAVTLKPYTKSSARVCFRTDRDPWDYQAVYKTVDIMDWEDIDFGRFSFDQNDAPREVFFQTKVKKYKRLQILIRNNTANEGFGVYAITKNFVNGNFAKR